MKTEISFSDVLEFIYSEQCNVRVAPNAAQFDDFVRNDAYYLDEQRFPGGQVKELPGRTIDSTSGYKAVEELLQRAQLSKAEETVLYRELGRRFAQEAEGKVQVAAQGILPWTEFEEVQLPTLLRNERVTHINDRRKEELAHVFELDSSPQGLIAASKVRELLQNAELSVAKAAKVLNSPREIGAHRDNLLQRIDKELEFLHTDEKFVRKAFAREAESHRIPILSRAVAYEIAQSQEGRDRLEKVDRKIENLNIAVDTYVNYERGRHFRQEALGWRSKLLHNQLRLISENRQKRREFQTLSKELAAAHKERNAIVCEQRSVAFERRVLERTEELMTRHQSFTTVLRRIADTRERLVGLRSKLEKSVEQQMGMTNGIKNEHSTKEQHLYSKRRRFDL